MAHYLSSEVTDNFNRSNSSNLGANWTECSGDCAIVGNVLVCTSAGSDLIYTGAAISSADSYVKATWTAGYGGGARPNLYLRATADSSDGYVAQFRTNESDVIFWRKIDSGWTSIANGGSHSYTTNDEITFTVETISGDPVLTAFVNGAPMLQYTDSNAAKITAAGYSGVRFSTTYPSLDNFEAGILDSYSVESGDRTSEFSDDFNRADSSSLGGDWSEVVNDTQIIKYLINGTDTNGNGGNEIVTTTAISGSSCYAKVNCWGTLRDGSRIGLALRTDDDFSDGYLASFRSNDGDVLFYRKVGGEYSVNLNTESETTTYAFQDEYLFTIENVSGNPVLTAYINGEQIATYTDTSEDKIVEAGYAGIRCSNEYEYVGFFDMGIIGAGEPASTLTIMGDDHFYG